MNTKKILTRFERVLENVESLFGDNPVKVESLKYDPYAELELVKKKIELDKTIKVKKIRYYSDSQKKYHHVLGQYQYVYSSSKGKISLIELVDSMFKPYRWEIFCLKGNLFDSIERFETKKEAKKRIEELLI